jgi:uncharacterized phage protein gp47/JayE
MAPLALRTFQETLNQYLQAIVGSGSGLTVDTTQGSFAYTLARAASSVATLQDRRLQGLALALNPATASDRDLDTLAEGYGLVRGIPSLAKGFCLAIANTTTQTLVAGRILVDLETGQQYVVTSTSVSIPTFAEVQVEVQATQAGSLYNLLAGTPLFCPEVPDITLTVGAAKQNGVNVGDINGGEDPESDASLRTRLLARSQPYSIAFLTQQLQLYPGVRSAFVSTVLGGTLEVWVNPTTVNFSSTELQNLKEYLVPFCPPGVLIVVLQAVAVSLEVVIQVTPLAQNTSFDSLSEALEEVVKQYFETLEINEAFVPQDLKANLRPLVQSCTVVAPARTLTPRVGQVLTFGSLKVQYPVAR